MKTFLMKVALAIIVLIIDCPLYNAQTTAAACISEANPVTLCVDGKNLPGHYAMISGALAAANSVPESEVVTIRIAPRILPYSENVVVDRAKVHLVGMAAGVVINGSRFKGANNPIPPGGQLHDANTATLQVTSRATDFVFENLTIENSYNIENRDNTETPGLTQIALALYIAGDRAFGRNIRLISRQDTFEASANHGTCLPDSCTTSSPTRVYLYQSYIEGSVDFIFGDGAVFMEDCTVEAREASSPAGPTFVTAQDYMPDKGTNSSKTYKPYISGFVFLDCTINFPANSLSTYNAYLGRAYSNHAKVFLYSTTINDFGSRLKVEQPWANWPTLSALTPMPPATVEFYAGGTSGVAGLRNFPANFTDPGYSNKYTFFNSIPPNSDSPNLVPFNP